MKAHASAAALLALAFLTLSCEGPVGPPGSGLGSLSDPTVMPRVLYTYPGASTVGPYDDLYRSECGWEWCYWYSQIQVRFNKFMDVSSVRRAVRLSSPLHDVRADTNFILSVGGDVFILIPVDTHGYRFNFRFGIGVPYTIGVDSTARDINGNPLRPAFAATFVPEPHFRVREASPANGAIDVHTYPYIVLKFNNRVTREILGHVGIDPPATGSWGVGYDSTEAAFTPASNLGTATRYTISVDGAAEDADGNRLPAPFSTSFTTVAFRVTAASPADGSTGIALTAVPSVVFSVPLDTGTIRSSFRIDPPTPGSFNGIYYGTSYVSYAPLDGLLGSTLYTVTVDSSVRATGGDRLGAPYEFSFTTAPFGILSTFPGDGATGVPRANWVTVYANAPLEYSTVAASIRVAPAAVIEASTCDGCSSFQFRAQAGFEANTTYTVTIGNALRTKRGEQLAAPHTLSFTTGPN